MLALPKVVTAKFGSDPNKRTVCVYGHVDVQPAKLEDGWATDPYNLTDINGNSYKDLLDVVFVRLNLDNVHKSNCAQ